MLNPGILTLKGLFASYAELSRELQPLVHPTHALMKRGTFSLEIGQSDCSRRSRRASTQTYVSQVQHSDMKGLMDSDVRNLHRLADFVKHTLPFDVYPVRELAVILRHIPLVCFCVFQATAHHVGCHYY